MLKNNLRYERSDSDSISALFSLLDYPAITWQNDSVYRFYYYYSYIFDPKKCNMFEINSDMKFDEDQEVSTLISKGLANLLMTCTQYILKKE